MYSDRHCRSATKYIQVDLLMCRTIRSFEDHVHRFHEIYRCIATALFATQNEGNVNYDIVKGDFLYSDVFY